VYIVTNGEKRFLEQPHVLVTPRPIAQADSQQTSLSATASTPGASASPSASDSTDPPDSTPSLQQTPLPPLHLEIPAIALNFPVVLVDNQHLPRIRLVGWFFRSAFPGTAGNLVLVGHLDGPAQTFGRLSELRNGAEIRVETAKATYVYTVDTSSVVLSSDVGVLAPTTDPVVTLITCAGDWNPVTRTYDRRLVVRGHLSGVNQKAVSQ